MNINNNTIRISIILIAINKNLFKSYIIVINYNVNLYLIFNIIFILDSNNFNNFIRITRLLLVSKNGSILVFIINKVLKIVNVILYL